MPYINIKITREGTTAEQKAELIKGATELLARVLNKNPKTTVVTIEEVDTDSWGIGGDPVEIAREKEKLRVAEIEKLKLSKDALVRELAELKGIPFALAADEPLHTGQQCTQAEERKEIKKEEQKIKLTADAKHFFLWKQPQCLSL